MFQTENYDYPKRKITIISYAALFNTLSVQLKLVPIYFC